MKILQYQMRLLKPVLHQLKLIQSPTFGKGSMLTLCSIFHLWIRFINNSKSTDFISYIYDQLHQFKNRIWLEVSIAWYHDKSLILL